MLLIKIVQSDQNNASNMGEAVSTSIAQPPIQVQQQQQHQQQQQQQQSFDQFAQVSQYPSYFKPAIQTSNLAPRYTVMRMPTAEINSTNVGYQQIYQPQVQHIPTQNFRPSFGPIIYSVPANTPNFIINPTDLKNLQIFQGRVSQPINSGFLPTRVPATVAPTCNAADTAAESPLVQLERISSTNRRNDLRITQEPSLLRYSLTKVVETTDRHLSQFNSVVPETTVDVDIDAAKEPASSTSATPMPLDLTRESSLTSKQPITIDEQQSTSNVSSAPMPLDLTRESFTTSKPPIAVDEPRSMSNLSPPAEIIPVVFASQVELPVEKTSSFHSTSSVSSLAEIDPVVLAIQVVPQLDGTPRLKNDEESISDEELQPPLEDTKSLKKGDESIADEEEPQKFEEEKSSSSNCDVENDSMTKPLYDKPMISCDVLDCNRKFRLFEHLKKHMAFHNKEINYICRDCGKGFTLKCHLAAHEKWHATSKKRKDSKKSSSDTNKFECDLCFQKFPRKPRLEKHVMSHTEIEEPRDEPKNDRIVLKIRRTRKQKIKMQQVKFVTPDYVCRMCKTLFQSLQDFNTHLKSQHNMMPYICDYPQCNRAFGYIKCLKRHMQSHDVNEKTFPCPNCDNNYRSRKSLRIHLISKH